MSDDFEESLLTVSEVAERLNCSEASVYENIAKKKLGAFRTGPNGGGLRVSVLQLKAFLEERRIHPGKDAPDFPLACKPVKLKHLR